MTLSYQSKSYLEEKFSSKINIHKLKIDEARHHFHEKMTQSNGNHKIHNIINSFIPCENYKIPIRIYQPSEELGNKPIMLFCHGGGFVMGGISSYDQDCIKFANNLDCIVVSIEYRLAPEYTHPTAIDDCYSALLWLYANTNITGGSKDKIFIAGDSSGGLIAASVIKRNIDAGGSLIKYQLLIYPVTDFTMSSASHRLFSAGYNLTKETLIWCYDLYFSKNTQIRKQNSPLFYESLSEYPPTLIITAEYDPLRDEGEKFSKKLMENRVCVKHKRFDGMLHGFISLSHLFQNGNDDAINYIAKELIEFFKD